MGEMIGFLIMEKFLNLLFLLVASKTVVMACRHSPIHNKLKQFATPKSIPLPASANSLSYTQYQNTLIMTIPIHAYTKRLAGSYLSDLGIPSYDVSRIHGSPILDP